MHLRTVSIGALLLSACAVTSAAAQSSTPPPPHVVETKPHLDTIATAEKRFCATRTARSFNYLCVTQRNVVALRALDSAVSVRVRVDTVVRVRVDTVRVDTINVGDSVRIIVRDTVKPLPPPSAFVVPPNLGSGLAAIADLPRDTVDATYPKVTRQVRLAATANLQAALDAAQPGDELRLAAGSTYTGEYSLPKHAGASATGCTAWIVLRTDVADSLLGAPGTRMDPTRAAALRLAKLAAPGNQQAIGSAIGVNNVGCWRLVGLEVLPATSGFDVNGLVRLGDNYETVEGEQAHHLVVDRSYVHGTAPASAGIGAQGTVRRCVVLQSRWNAVIDSYTEKCRGGNGDTQSVLAYAGTGPYLLRNNWFSGGTEVFMSGGATSGIPNAVPSNWTIHGNVFTRELADTLTLVKNLVEFKNAEYIDLAGNVMRLNWPNGQVGFALLAKSVNQSSGPCTWCRTRHLTVRYNRITMSASGMNLAGIQEGPAMSAGPYTVYRNVIDSLGFRSTEDAGRPLQILGNGSLTDVTIAFNTVGPTSLAAGGQPWGLISWSGAVARIALQSNVFFCGGYGVKGDGLAQGMNTLTALGTPYAWSGNALYGCASGYPTGTAYFPTFSAAAASLP